MAAFVQWLAPRLDDVRTELPQKIDALATELEGGAADRRTVRLLADLAAGLEFFLRFAWEVGALTAVEAKALG